MTKSIVYVIDNYKIRAGLLFYVLVVISILSLSNLASRTSVDNHVSAASLPYEVTDHHAKPSELLTPAFMNPVWPLHGQVTTEFGASDYPYQTHHTGIDISSGSRSGVNQIVAFQSGTVTSVIHSSVSFGNHVIIDHGNGLTSLYGHLSSIKVFAGQQVRAGDTLGTEGSTGASTGPHVHFEIRVNNKPVNPRNYIVGRP